MLRNILAVVIGIILAFSLIEVCEAVGHHLWPPPQGIDFGSREAIRAAITQMPFGALASVAVAWVVGAFGGGWVAARISRRARPAYVIGGLVVLASIAELVMIPHPFWFWIIALIVVPLAAHLAAKLGATPMTTEATIPL